MTEPLWRPSGRATQLQRFRNDVATLADREMPDYAALHAWSVAEPDAFWRHVWQFTGLVSEEPPQSMLSGRGVWDDARWGEGCQLNYAANLLRFRDERIALVALSEFGERQTITYAELSDASARIAAALQSFGVAPGDRVAGWLPNVIETVVAMLATAQLGAVWSSCSPDFGAEGALDRFGQIEPKVLFACDGYVYAGKHFDTRTKMTRVARDVSSIKHLIWVPTLRGAPVAEGTGQHDWSSLLAKTAPSQSYHPCAFNDPLYILYSSGTTGKPKCIVHGVGGTLIQHAKEHVLHVDLTRDDTLFFFTTCGWMMWNWLVSALATGCRIVLYEGSPFHPTPSALMDLAASESVSVFGAGAKYLAGIHKEGLQPIKTHDLGALRCLLSTGSPLAHEGFDYVYSSIKSDVHLASISGGTDLISCFVLGNPEMPVWRGEIQCAGLGMAVEVWNERSEPVRGEKGELVCTQPFPSAPIGFWNDPDDRRYHDAYFSRFPGVWTHGDYAEITSHGGFVIHGRSDTVLNPGGVRIGTAEIYRQVEQIPVIREAVCVGQEWEDDTRVVLFVLLADDYTLDDALVAEIRQRIRTHASPRHVPARVVAVADIPRTLNGKISELAVRDVIHGRTVGNAAALANPEALDLYRNIEALAQ